MTALDWTIVVVYLAGCTLAGLWMRPYVRNVDDFAIAAREMEVNLGWPRWRPPRWASLP